MAKKVKRWIVKLCEITFLSGKRQFRVTRFRIGMFFDEMEEKEINQRIFKIRVL